MLKEIVDRWQKFDSATSAAGWIWWLFQLATGLTAGALMGYLAAKVQWFWDAFGWAGVVGIGILTWAVIGFGLNSWSSWLRPHGQVSRRGISVEFGSPAQRAKDENEALWHIPIKMRPPRWAQSETTLSDCQAFLDRYVGDVVVEKIRLCWGDLTFEVPRDLEDLHGGRTSLIPVAWRTEKGDDRNGYFADARLARNRSEKIHPIPSGRGKHRFKLRVKSGTTSFQSPHFYLVRTPLDRSNGHFIVEQEYEGEGTQTSHPPITMVPQSQPALATPVDRDKVGEPTVTVVVRSLTPEQKDRKLRALDKLRDQVRKMQPLINRAERLSSPSAWNSFSTGHSADYTIDLLDFKGDFDHETQALSAVRDQLPEYEDAMQATFMPDRERWIGHIGDHLVTSQALFTYLKPETTSDVFQRLASEDAEKFSKFVRSYIDWHNHARVSLDHLCREVAK